MIYVDTDFLLALGKPSDWLGDRAEAYLDRYRGELTTSLVTFVELFLLSKRYDLDRTTLAAESLELLDVGFDEDIVFQADELIDRGHTVFDAFHLATALTRGHPVLSSDQAFDDLPVERLPLEQEPDG